MSEDRAASPTHERMSRVRHFYQDARAKVQDAFLKRGRDFTDPHTKGLVSDLAKEQAREAIQALKDPVTSLYNRKGYEEVLASEIAKAKKNKHPISIFMMDIQGLGQFNNDYSLDAGDELIKTTAAMIQQEIRGGDAGARWGGDEFAIVFPNTTPEQAEMVAKRVEKALNRPHYLKIVQDGAPITVIRSIGIRGIVGEIDPKHPEASEQVIKEELSILKADSKKAAKQENPIQIEAIRTLKQRKQAA